MVAAELPFKFRFVKNGQTQSLFSQKGIATAQSLCLGKETLPYSAIAETTTRDRRIVLALTSTDGLSQKLSKSLATQSAIVLEVYNCDINQLEKFIDRIASEQAIERRRQELAATGQAHLLRTAKCPHCEANIDLSDFERSPYVYCPFCETVFQEGRAIVTSGEVYRLCDECRSFDRVRGYTEFYFYFLVFVYGFYYKRRHVCDHCANGIFWKTFWLNLVFLVGIIPSLMIKFKAMSGRDPALRQLAKANALALKGKYQEADVIYANLYNNFPDHPGLLMNQGRGHLAGKDSIGGLVHFTRAVKSCGNYYPVLRILNQFQQQ